MTRNRLAVMLVCSFLVLFGRISAFGQDEPSSGPDQDHGAKLYASNCAYCHGADGRGGRGPSIATLPNVIALSNKDLMGIVHKGETDQGMPGFPDLGDEGIRAVVQYLRALQGVTADGAPAKLPGDPDVGRQIFLWQSAMLNLPHAPWQRRIYGVGADLLRKESNGAGNPASNCEAGRGITADIARSKRAHQGRTNHDRRSTRGRQSEHNPAD